MHTARRYIEHSKQGLSAFDVAGISNESWPVISGHTYEQGPREDACLKSGERLQRGPTYFVEINN